MPVLLTAAVRSDELDIEIERAAELLRDLKHLREHVRPSMETLHQAPVLHGWSPAFRPVACLHGRPSGHPRLSGRQDALTSPLYVLSLELGFARTESRFWRLGTPAVEASDA
ncbi:DUF6634 family protein [Antarcticirhabdus aurantiaca]|uniref:Uncharacterized protein n=1 Tax=Antarcticirhabdus aurantiaca TaxID=2606717 RepID=A0ACD4NRW3_9HYPH|nr:DUF6634 family protein [Antarcticirhabdus aurantiaca]WAJ29462.1 hypothetical protein OXU80_04285 [Jeongeuplla avenae]